MTKQNSGRTIYEYKLATGATWPEVADHFGGSADGIRRKARTYYEKHGLAPPGKVNVVGGMNGVPREAPPDIWERAVAVSESQQATQDYKQTASVIFEDGPAVLVFMADLHLGSSGVNYSEIDNDIRTINHLADNGVNVGVFLVGDMLDNMIIGKLKNLRLNNSPFLAIEEWGLVDYALERLAPHLLGSVAGNHDNWSYALAGVDPLRERHRQLTPGILYDMNELSFTLQVAGFQCQVMLRHAWRGNSMYNPTHAIDSAHNRRGRAFDIAVGAHTHRGGLAREFDNGGCVGHALICGSYKKHDTYAMRLGFPPPLNTSAVAVVVDGDGVLFSTSNLGALPRLLETQNN